MLIKTSDNTAINPEYIINLYLRDGSKLEPSVVPTMKHQIVARMIDGTLLELFKSDSKEEAEKEYNDFIKITNVHQTWDLAVHPNLHFL